MAASGGHVEVIKFLQTKGIMLDATDKVSMNKLWCADFLPVAS